MFKEVKGRFGFGCMRLPMKGNEVDIEQVNVMVDKFIDAGFNYFDTAHGYIDGLSEKAVKTCVSDRYERNKFILANKLTGPYFKCEADIVPLFESQLEICGVDYFDFYLMHCQTKEVYKKFKECNAYNVAYKLKEEGKVKHVGFSFHDNAEVLDMILTEQPQVEFVQLQFNYLDYNDYNVQAKKCLEVCIKHGKPVIVMEPVRGGVLANLPVEGAEELKKVWDHSAASFALRFVGSFEQVFMILSGMGTIQQMEDNINHMKEIIPFSDAEYKIADVIASITRSKKLIECTNCRYCVAGCPKKILIPDMFKSMNSKNPEDYLRYTIGHGKASECIKCGKCEKECPQHLPIRSLMEDIAKRFE